MKKWWFSVLCYLIALSFPIYTLIALALFEEELLFYMLVLTSSITPSLMFLVIGVANQPRKENKNEN